MRLYRLFADKKRVGDLFVSHAAADCPGDLRFPAAELALEDIFVFFAGFAEAVLHDSRYIQIEKTQTELEIASDLFKFFRFDVRDMKILYDFRGQRRFFICYPAAGAIGDKFIIVIDGQDEIHQTQKAGIDLHVALHSGAGHIAVALLATSLAAFFRYRAAKERGVGTHRQRLALGVEEYEADAVHLGVRILIGLQAILADKIQPIRRSNFILAQDDDLLDPAAGRRAKDAGAAIHTLYRKESLSKKATRNAILYRSWIFILYFLHNIRFVQRFSLLSS